MKWQLYLVRISMTVLCVALWLLGDVPKSYSMGNSPDGRFSLVVTGRCGWRSFDFHGVYRCYVRQNATGKRLLAATQSRYCGFEEMGIRQITWDGDSRRFTCFWAIQGNGFYPQFFQISANPFAVKASAPCCDV